MIKFIVAVMGLISLGLAVLGAVLPLLPTTPFVLLSGVCFSYSSPRLNRMLINNPAFGPMLTNWRTHGAISSSAKKMAVITLLATFLVSIALHVPMSVLIVQGLILACVLVFIVSRPLPPAA